MPPPIALGLLALEVAILAGGLMWTFRRAQLPVGWLGALGLAAVVGASQALLAAVVEVAVGLATGDPPFAVTNGYRLHWASVLIGALAVCVAAPLALQRFLRLNRRWTRALSRELLAGFIASTFGAVVIMGVLFILGAIVAGLLRGH